MRDGNSAEEAASALAQFAFLVFLWGMETTIRRDGYRPHQIRF